MTIKNETIKALSELVQTMEGKETPFVLMVADNDGFSIGSNIKSRDGMRALGVWMGNMIVETVDENAISEAARTLADREQWPEALFEGCTVIQSDAPITDKGLGVGWRGPYFTTEGGDEA